MSTSLAVKDVDDFSSPFKVDNSDGKVKKINDESLECISSFKNEESFRRRIKEAIEASAISTTQKEEQPIDYLQTLALPFIAERNKIMDSFFKYHNPYYRKKLHEIDKKLDEIDLKIYKERVKNMPTEHALENMVRKAQEKLEKYSSFISSE